MITVRPMRLLPRSPPLDVTEVLLLVVVFAVPVTVVPWASNAFELPKAALLCFLVLILAALGLGQFLIADRQRRLRWRAGWRHPLLWPVVAFSLALVLATLQSTNLLVSLRGSYERQQGLLTQLAYPALLLLTVPLLRTRQQMARLWEALVWTSAPVVAYGLLQALGVDPLGWQTDATSPVLSTLGRANFLGSYLVLMAPLTGGLLLINRRRSLLALLLLGQLTCLALTLARGAWIGLAAALLTLALAWAWHTGQRRLAAMALGTTLLLLALLVLLNLPQRPLGLLADLPGLDRLASLSDTRAGSSAARLTIWRATLPLLQARPWLGYGPDTMRTTFAAVYPPQLVYYQGRQTVVDRAHNLWLDLGMSAGLLGILTFTAVLAAFIRMAWRALRAACDRWTAAAWTALLAAVTGHLVDLQVSFDVTATAATFWLMLALAAALGRPGGLPATAKPVSPANPNVPGIQASAGLPQGSQVPNNRLKPPFQMSSATTFGIPAVSQGNQPGARATGPVGYLLGGIALALAIPLTVQPVLADLAHWQAQQSRQPLTARLEAAERAVRLNPAEPTYRLTLAAVAVQRGDWSAGEAAARQGVALAPDDAVVWA
ncbi:MAG: O-antigen ligase family protein, partial [Anaerolineae bacterium]